VSAAQPEVANPPATEGEKPAQVKEQTRTDRYGDPLPPSAVARLGTLRLRSEGAAFILFSPDCKTLISAHNRGLRAWDVATGQELGWLTDAPASAGQFAPDGKTLITADRRGIIRYWHGKQMLRQTELSLPPRHSRASFMSMDGKVVGMVDPGYGTRIWDTVTGKQSFELKRDDRSDVLGVALSPDGKILALPIEGNRIRLVKIGTGEEIRSLEGPSEVEREQPARPRGSSDWLTSLVFSRDGALLAATGPDTVSVWEIGTGKRLYTVPEGWGHLSFSPDRKYLVHAGPGAIWLYEAARGTEVWRFEECAGYSRKPAFSPDGKILAIDNGDTIILLDVATGKRVHSFSGHGTPVISLAFSPDGSGLASGDYGDGMLILWDLNRRKPFHALRGHVFGVLSVAYSPDGKLVATGDGHDRGSTGGLDAQIRLWRVADGKLLRQFPGHINSVQDIAFSPDGKMLATAGHDARTKLWEVATGKRLRQLRGADAQFRSVAFSPEGGLLAVASTSGELAIWRIDSGQKVRDFGAIGDERRGVGQVVFLPDGKTILSREFRSARGGGQDEFHFWDRDSGKELRSFGMETRNPHRSCYALSPDGKTVAVVPSDFNDYTIQLRDVATGKIVGQLKGHTNGWVTALAFSSDSKILASGGQDTTVLLWDVSRARLEHLWSELAGSQEDAALAVKKLKATPEKTVPFLKERLHRAAVREAAASKFIADLDADNFEVRERHRKHSET
jgi:WD40 repeat protein